MFDYLTRLSLEADVDDRKAKRKARSQAYWKGHTMGRFHNGIAKCKTCNKTTEVSGGQVRGLAITETCTQQLIPEITNNTFNNH